MIKENLKALSSDFKDSENLVIILAAGHGKRIKSSTSKMLHELWGKTTVERVLHAMNNGIKDTNTVVVVGIKALDVANSIGKRDNLSFALQEEQNGTGHAVLVALESVDIPKTIKYCYVVYADMGLMNAEAISDFKLDFMNLQSDMIALTGIFEGEQKDNYYGRIVRTKEFTATGQASKYKDFVIEIKEHKDILALDGKYIAKYKDETFEFSKEELLSTKEYNTGVYGFKLEYLQKYITQLKTNNAQNELYITDLISIFNEENLSVAATSPANMNVVLGFNNKSVLKEMQNIACKDVYEKIKDIIMIEDENSFFIADDVVNNIIALDESSDRPLDIYIGRGSSLSSDVLINYGLSVGCDVVLHGDIEFGENVYIGDRSSISSSKECSINIGDNTIIEHNVNITNHAVVGSNVIIKINSSISGCKIDDNVVIEHSILYNKHIKCSRDSNNNIIPVRFVIPEAQGLDSIEDL